MIGCNEIMIRHCVIRELVDIVPLNNPMLSDLAAGPSMKSERAYCLALNTIMLEKSAHSMLFIKSLFIRYTDPI